MHVILINTFKMKKKSSKGIPTLNNKRPAPSNTTAGYDLKTVSVGGAGNTYEEEEAP